MPINIDNKGVAFEAPDTSPVVINYHHFEAILNKAKQENPVSEDILTKLALVDDYIISHFRVAFGNRIMKQIKDYVPAYIGTGGTEIDGLIAYMDELFGEENMGECKSYLRMLKKLV